MAALPTQPREPAQWRLPAKLAGPPAALLIGLAGMAGCFLSCRWAGDSYAAAIMTDRLLAPDRATQRRPLPPSVTPPGGPWAYSTAQHLAHWAVFLSRNEAADANSRQTVTSLVLRALAASPLNPTVRLIFAQLESAEDGARLSVRSLGQSRDATSLAWSAGKLWDAGHKEAALLLYAQAIALVSSRDGRRAARPGFSADPEVARYLLPGEERLRDVVRRFWRGRNGSLQTTRKRSQATRRPCSPQPGFRARNTAATPSAPWS